MGGSKSNRVVDAHGGQEYVPRGSPLLMWKEFALNFRHEGENGGIHPQARGEGFRASLVGGEKVSRLHRYRTAGLLSSVK